MHQNTLQLCLVKYFLRLFQLEDNLLPKRKPLPLTHIFNPLSTALQEMEKQQEKEEHTTSLQVQLSPRGMQI